MTEKGSEGANKTYTCPECGLSYADKETRDQCQAWCAEHHSCNLDIIKNALPQ